MKVMQTLVRREFWEHRSLWMAPLIAAGLMVLGTLFSGTPGDITIELNGKDSQEMAQMFSGDRQAKIFGAIIAGIGVPITFVMLVVLLFYLADALYGERKDRSILFWKSMPVSDAQTVWSKVLTAMAAVPLYTWVLSGVTATLCYLILWFRLRNTMLSNIGFWDTGLWLKIQSLTFVNIVIAALWYSPIAAWVLAISAWARRTVLVWVVLPPALLMFLEKVTFNTQHVAQFVGYRLGGFFRFLDETRTGGALRTGAASAKARAEQITDRLDHYFATPLLANPDLWLGMLAAVALIFLAIRGRRYRDDT